MIAGVSVCDPAGTDPSPELRCRPTLETGFISALADICVTPRWAAYPFSFPCEDDDKSLSPLFTVRFCNTWVAHSCPLQSPNPLSLESRNAANNQHVY